MKILLKRILYGILFIPLLMPMANLYAAESAAWLEPEVIQAALRIDLTQEQQPLFKAALTSYLQDMGQMVQKVIASNKGDLAHEIKRRNRKLVKAMDAQMKSFLTAEQVPAYEIYRDTLQDHLY